MKAAPKIGAAFLLSQQCYYPRYAIVPAAPITATALFPEQGGNFREQSERRKPRTGMFPVGNFVLPRHLERYMHGLPAAASTG